LADIPQPGVDCPGRSCHTAWLFSAFFLSERLARPLRNFGQEDHVITSFAQQEQPRVGVVENAGASRLLIVEDDDLTRKFLTGFFGTMGYSVSVAATAEQAIRIAGDVMPGLVLTDFQLPGMDGIGMVRSLKNAGHRVPFILISGFLTEDVEAEAKDAGIALVLRKPLELSMLQDSVRSLLPIPGTS
jgi:CheY-like chemotaxis protein